MAISIYITAFLIIYIIIISIYYKKNQSRLKLKLKLRDRIDNTLNIIRNTQQSNFDNTDNTDTKGITGTILILDDQGPIVFLLTQLLERHDFTVVSFTDPSEAFEYFKLNKDTVDLIITDYSIPIMRGNKIIKTFKDIKNVPLIVFTGHSYITFKNEEERKLVDGVLYKPAQADIIITKVIELLQKFRGPNNEKIRID